MMEFYKKKPVLASLILIAVGVLVTSGIFVYYGFHLGIKPCKGLPSDTENCGNGDFGGLYFILIGVPIIIFGVVRLLDSFIVSRKGK